MKCKHNTILLNWMKFKTQMNIIVELFYATLSNCNGIKTMRW